MRARHVGRTLSKTVLDLVTEILCTRTNMRTQDSHCRVQTQSASLPRDCGRTNLLGSYRTAGRGLPIHMNSACDQCLTRGDGQLHSNSRDQDASSSSCISGTRDTLQPARRASGRVARGGASRHTLQPREPARRASGRVEGREACAHPPARVRRVQRDAALGGLAGVPRPRRGVQTRAVSGAIGAPSVGGRRVGSM
jgi:hypothetical protein